MFKAYFESFRSKVPLSIEEEEVIAGYLSTRTVSKKELILNAGEVCNAAFFVSIGLLRAFTIDENESQHTVQFAPEGWLISDLYSFITGEKGTFNIEAIENSELVVITSEAHEEMLEVCPKYEKLTRIQMTNAYVALQKRINSSVTAGVEERYLSFVNSHCDLAQRVPQKIIASYLGLTPETLSRIKRRLAEKGE
ncbi:Crp/Fnr family transcriptional regulator [Fulvivirga maritima]|uniref:Crp/Fnr family transcriptional regulator n=1 Tax=Fulvivirga maritima TaxID=2904247 RepID=UPI001F3B3100|nr:Crp/Fnr family transcriptional regulator [Fulvivirga maritima]UII24613.1 Crp/Fnr family transcriptional regulator [Fulvivirga maritima]